MRNSVPTRSEWTPERLASAGKSAAIVVGAAILLGVFAIAASFYYIAAIAAAAVLVILVAWQFEAALVLYVLVAFVPWGVTPDLAVGGSGIGKGVYVSQIMLGFLLVIWCGKYLMKGLPKERARSGFYVPLALYLAYSILNIVNAYIFWDPHVDKIYQHTLVNVIEVGLRFLSAGALVMMATSITSRKWLKWITPAIMIPGFYNLLDNLIPTGVGFSAPWWPLVVLLPVSFCWGAALDPSLSVIKRVAGAVVTAIAFVAVLVQSIHWVSGWAALIAAVGTVTFIRNRRVFVVFLLVGLAAALIHWEFLQVNVVEESKESGDYDRFALLSGAWKYATKFPLGVGLGNYRTYNSFYYGIKWGTTAYTSAHGNYAQHLSEMGIPGLALFWAVLGCGFAWMYRSYQRLKQGPSKTFLLAALGQMAGILVAAAIGDYILPTYHNAGLTTFSSAIYSWLIWGLAIAHVRIYDTEQLAESEIDIGDQMRVRPKIETG